jgi:hypothetical protein
MPRKSPRCHDKGRSPSIIILLGLIGLIALPAGFLQPTGHAASTLAGNETSAAATGCSAANFGAARTVDVNMDGRRGGLTTDLAIADFNGDGRADMAVSHQGQSGATTNISVMLDDGAGGYTAAPPIIYWFGSTFYRMLTGDFNKDGKMDIAASGTLSEPFSQVVSINMGNGDGTFAASVNINITAFGSVPYDLVSGDLNADGNLDLVTVTASTGGFTVLLGNGFGGFNIFGSFSPGTNFDRIALGDFNQDAKQDLVITDSGDKRVLLLSGLGNGGFGALQAFSVPGTSGAITAGDFNADGKPDVAVATYPIGGSSSNEDGNVAVLLGDGAGGFAPAVNYIVGKSPQDILTGDFDGDGKADLAISNILSANIAVLSGDGAGAFRAPVYFDTAGAPTALSAHDINADGRPDLAALFPFPDAVRLLFGAPPLTLPCLAAEDVTLTEGDAGTSDANVTVRLSEATAQEVKVDYALSTGSAPDSATVGQDFTAVTGTLTFAPGETTKVVAVPIIGDTLHEFDETLTLNLSNPVNARMSDAAATIRITNNDSPPSATINDVSITEGSTAFDFKSATFTVTISAPSAKVVRVDYATSAGTATAGADFANTTGSVLFAPGSTTATLSVFVSGDLTHEPDETFFVNLSNPGDSTIADAQGVGTILNDDPLPTITALSTSTSEVTGQDSTATLIVRLSNPSSQTVSVDYATADGSAQAGADYVATSGTLNFAPGETAKTIALTIKDDTLDELPEAFLINFSNPTNATIGDVQASCNINDNDGPAVSINDISVVEGQSGRVAATFTLTLSAPSPQTVLVRARTNDGTAVAGNFPAGDYQQTTNRTIFFAPNTTTATFTVFAHGDVMIEPDETFFVDLSQPQDCTIADSRGVVTIVNDDVTSVRFASEALSVNEKDGSVLVTVARLGDLSGTFVAAYTTFDGTATERSDYIDSRGVLRFEPGESSKTFAVFVTDDALVESPETFSLFLNGEAGGTVNSPSLIQVTINSDDVAAGPNPIDSTSFFVKQHYRDFLNREPDADGLAFWTNEIEQCAADVQCREVKRINVSAAFFLSIEFQENGYLIYRTNKVMFDAIETRDVALFRENMVSEMLTLGRDVIVGKDGWQLKVEQNKQTYFNGRVASGGFLSLFPTSMTPEQFVDALNRNADGALSPAERDALVADLKANVKTRAQVLRAVAEDEDLARAETNRAFVLMQYFGYLRRNPDSTPDIDFTGYNFWLGKLNEFGGNFINAEMVKAFITSDEYRKRFGQ